jgi:hypothetical protein
VEGELQGAEPRRGRASDQAHVDGDDHQAEGVEDLLVFDDLEREEDAQRG